MSSRILRAAVSSLLLPALAAAAPSIKPVYQFASTAAHLYPHGAGPHDAVIEAPNGSFFTTTEQGGISATCNTIAGCGTIVQITASAEKVLYSFPVPAAGNTAGAFPIGGLVQGPDGALYGTTFTGPTTQANTSGGYGTIFKLVAPVAPATAWVLQTLHVFAGGAGNGSSCPAAPDGAQPVGRLVFAPDGYVYGTTSGGGCVIVGTGGDAGPYYNQGILFRIAPDGTNYLPLHSFNGSFSATPDGTTPQAGLTLAPDGNLYGTSHYGGTYGLGTVYQYNLTSGAVTVIHSFTGQSPDGGTPLGDLSLDGAGTLWSTTYTSDNGDDATYNGTVFSITPSLAPAFKSYTFPANGGYTQPQAGLIPASDGNFYGTASAGGFYEFSPAAGFTDRYYFPSSLTITAPIAIPLQAANGKIYVTTSSGGPVNAKGYTDEGGVFVYSNSLAKPKPVVSYFMPNNGAVGTPVVIGGANFVGAKSVTFKGAAAIVDPVVNASGFITVNVPTGAVSGPVTVRNAGGSTTSTAVFAVP